MVDRQATCQWLVKLSNAISEEVKSGDEITFHNLQAFHAHILDVMALILEAPSVPRIITDFDELVGREGAVYVEYNQARCGLDGEWVFVDYIAQFDGKPTNIYLIRRHGAQVMYKTTGYGVTWRAWTDRPNQAEMEARPWLS